MASVALHPEPYRTDAGSRMNASPSVAVMFMFSRTSAWTRSGGARHAVEFGEGVGRKGEVRRGEVFAQVRDR